MCRMRCPTSAGRVAAGAARWRGCVPASHRKRSGHVGVAACRREGKMAPGRRRGTARHHRAGLQAQAFPQAGGTRQFQQGLHGAAKVGSIGRKAGRGSSSPRWREGWPQRAEAGEQNAPNTRLLDRCGTQVVAACFASSCSLSDEGEGRMHAAPPSVTDQERVGRSVPSLPGLPLSDEGDGRMHAAPPSGTHLGTCAEVAVLVLPQR